MTESDVKVGSENHFSLNFPFTYFISNISTFQSFFFRRVLLLLHRWKTPVQLHLRLDYTGVNGSALWTYTWSQVTVCRPNQCTVRPTKSLNYSNKLAHWLPNDHCRSRKSEVLGHGTTAEKEQYANFTKIWVHLRESIIRVMDMPFRAGQALFRLHQRTEASRRAEAGHTELENDITWWDIETEIMVPRNHSAACTPCWERVHDANGTPQIQKKYKTKMAPTHKHNRWREPRVTMT